MIKQQISGDKMIEQRTHLKPALEQIDRNKIYTEKQFLAAIGRNDSRTLSKYVNAGLAVYKPKGTGTAFIRGEDWFTFLGQENNLVANLEDLAEEKSPVGQLAGMAFTHEEQIERILSRDGYIDDCISNVSHLEDSVFALSKQIDVLRAQLEAVLTPEQLLVMSKKS